MSSFKFLLQLELILVWVLNDVQNDANSVFIVGSKIPFSGLSVVFLHSKGVFVSRKCMFGLVFVLRAGSTKVQVLTLFMLGVGNGTRIQNT